MPWIEFDSSHALHTDNLVELSVNLNEETGTYDVLGRVVGTAAIVRLSTWATIALAEAYIDSITTTPAGPTGAVTVTSGLVDVAKLRGLVSTSNSTAVLLAANATFTGGYETVRDWHQVSVVVLADVAGTLHVDWSTDGVGAAESTETYAVSAGVPLPVFRSPQAEYVRVRYVNGGTQQGSFALQTIYRPVTPGPYELERRVGDVAASPLANTIQDRLKQVKATLDAINSNTDGLEGFTDGVEGLLTALRDNADSVETLLTTIRDNADGVETTLTSVLAAVDGLEAFVDGLEGLLTTIRDNADELEARVGEVSTTPTANTLQDRLKGIKSTLDAISASTDGLEGFVDGIEGLLIVIRDNADSVEAKLDALLTELQQKTEPANQQVVVEDRLSQKTGRVHKTITARAITANTTLYNVTAEKIFYATSVSVTVHNTSVMTQADVALLDDATVKFPVVVGVAFAGTVAPAHSLQLSFEEPLQFDTSVKWDIATGTPTASIVLVGYEE